MNTRRPAIVSFRERLLQQELAWAETVHRERGVGGLLLAAADCLDRVSVDRTDFQSFGSELAHGPASQRQARVEAYLRRTSSDARALARDLRALRRQEPGVFDLAVFGERLAQRCNARECRAEACLVLGRSHSPKLDSHQLNGVLDMARRNGRWSRRVEAVGWLARSDPDSGEPAAAVRALLVDLARPDEQRWVQAAAFAALAKHDPESARSMARARLLHPGPGDDFLVRAAIVGLCSLRKATPWPDVIELAHDDSSEHVRITAARTQRERAQLERIAAQDPSRRVRASALIRLANRHPMLAQPALRHALTDDAHAFVVSTAAQELARLGRRQPTRVDALTLSSLRAGSNRADLTLPSRQACRDAAFELETLARVAPETLEALRSALRNTPVGGVTTLGDERLLGLSDAQLAPLLALLARDDFGVGVDRRRSGLVFYRGERQSWSLWRTLHELLRPGPAKRQGVSHVVTRRLRGALRAPPGGLAEVTATRVPGERVLAKIGNDWGRELPRVEDLLGPALSTRIASASGVATVSLPRPFVARIRAIGTLILHYAHFAELRQQSIDASDAHAQSAFARAIRQQTGIRIELAPYEFDAPETEPAVTKEPRALGLALLPLMPLAATGALLDGLWRVLTSAAADDSGEVGLSHLAGYGAIVLGGLLVRQARARRSVATSRAAIPIVMGGWGTRGKSGTERLKAALFQGLGYECLVKTTGCEAMFIHAVPGLPAREIFIYRPYDKATVWEQKTVLSLAARLGVRAFLWECMALQPELVNLLQTQWMQDDVSTITNAYPDHEDLQGPTGLDVAETITEFLPRGATAFTTEQQMLPLMRRQAELRGTRLIAVSARETELIAADLLARFGHSEHPSNVALVAALARRAGVPSAVAIAEMADHVVADLGALKTYPSAERLGRRLSFSNGMGANDRAATLENWARSGFGTKTNGWTVTLVNNRADRPARSVVFAELMVKDLIADRHVLIGTNLSGLVRALRRALTEHTRALAPTRDLPSDATAHAAVMCQRIGAAFQLLLVDDTILEGVERDAARLGICLPGMALIEVLLEPAGTESYEVAKARVSAGLASEAASNSTLVALLARRRVLRSLLAAARTTPPGRTRLDEQFSRAYHAIFMDNVTCLADPNLSGDAVIEALAAQLPAGAQARIMGMQNIKGTGLDFVYRWVALETVTRACRGLESPAASERRDALVALMVHDDYGILDATLARDAIARARAIETSGDLPYEAAHQKLTQIVLRREALLRSGSRQGWAFRVRSFLGETFDFADAVRRRLMATRVIGELAAARISHATAAQRMRRILARSKGAWLSAST